MRKIAIILVLLLFSVSFVYGAEKLKIKHVNATASTAATAVSTDNVASKLIAVNFDANTTGGELIIFDGDSQRYYLAHQPSTIGPFTREDAPIFDTDIDYQIIGAGNATFVYIELE